MEHSQTVLPPVPEMRLRFPVLPLRFSFSGAELGGYETPLRLYRVESLWLRTPSLSLLTIGGQDRALELDCHLTCQSIVVHTAALEARVALPSMGAIKDPHPFLRHLFHRDEWAAGAPVASGLCRSFLKPLLARG